MPASPLVDSGVRAQALGADAVAVWFGEVEGFDERMVRFAAALR